MSEVVEVCSRTDARVKILPSITSSLKGNISSNLRDISYKDLLYRDEIDVNDVGIDENIRNKVIMVTGGGGSIGSELCRQIAKRNPKTLIILDIYENNAYAIQMELKNLYKDELDLRVVIASVRDYDRLKLLFEKYRPEMIFHVAAHKHVPLMEISLDIPVQNVVVDPDDPHGLILREAAVIAPAVRVVVLVDGEVVVEELQRDEEDHGVQGRMQPAPL